MTKWLHTLLAMAVPCSLLAQVHVDLPIILTGADPMDRQVTGLPLSTGSGDALTAGVAQSGILHSITGVTGNDWAATIPGTTDLAIGLHVVVRSPVTSTGPVTLILNGQGPFGLMRGSLPVDGAELVTGSMVSLIFDGAAMQLINGVHDRIRSCPTGMVPASTQFCIEPGQRPGVDFFSASVTCASAGRRLCTWSEFYLGCANVDLGLMGTTDNWEWSNNTANEDNSVRVVGQGTCMATGTWPATGNAPLQYRCCYSR